MTSKGMGLFLQALPLDQVRRFAREADSRGFNSAWFPEITFADAFVPAAAASLETERIRLAIGVVGIWSRSPAAMALSAATLNQLSGGRVMLGLGLQARTYVENWHGRIYERPVQAMREYVTILRRILAGERVSFEGEIFTVRDFQLHMPPPESLIPVYIAAIGPKMVELAGEVADGVLGYFYSRPYVDEVVMPGLRAGAARAGRTLDEFDVACGFPTLVGSDSSAFDLHKGQVLMFALAGKSSPFYAESFARAGFADQLREVQERVAQMDIEGALKTISPEMVDAMTLTGSADHVRERIEDYRRSGIGTVCANPSPPGLYFPLYQGHFPDGTEFPQLCLPDYLEVIERVVRLPDRS